MSLSCPRGYKRVGNRCKKVWHSGKGKALVLGGIAILVIVVLAVYLIPMFSVFSDYASPTGTVYEYYDAEKTALENVKVKFYLQPNDDLRPPTTTDAQGNYLMGWDALSGEQYVVVAEKSGYYDTQFLWTAPKVSSDVDTFPVSSIGMKVYSTSYTMVVRDKYATTPADIDDITDQDTNAPNIEIGQGGVDANPDRDEIIIEVIITNTDLDSVLGSNYYDYIDNKQRGFIMTMTVEDASTTSADYDQLEVVGWQKRQTDGKDWYAKEISPVEYMDDEDGDIISGKDGKLFIEITLDISQCNDLRDGATDTNGILISIGIHDMTTVNDFLWDNDLKPDSNEIIGVDESYLTFELVDTTGAE